MKSRNTRAIWSFSRTRLCEFPRNYFLVIYLSLSGSTLELQRGWVATSNYRRAKYNRRMPPPPLPPPLLLSELRGAPNSRCALAKWRMRWGDSRDEREYERNSPAWIVSRENAQGLLHFCTWCSGFKEFLGFSRLKIGNVRTKMTRKKYFFIIVLKEKKLYTKITKGNGWNVFMIAWMNIQLQISKILGAL